MTAIKRLDGYAWRPFRFDGSEYVKFWSIGRYQESEDDYIASISKNDGAPVIMCSGMGMELAIDEVAFPLLVAVAGLQSTESTWLESFGVVLGPVEGAKTIRKVMKVLEAMRPREDSVRKKITPEGRAIARLHRWRAAIHSEARQLLDEGERNGKPYGQGFYDGLIRQCEEADEIVAKADREHRALMRRKRKEKRDEA